MGISWMESMYITENISLETKYLKGKSVYGVLANINEFDFQ